MSRVEVIGDATLYLGDCRDVLPTLGVCSEIAVTSPPYNMGLVPGGNGRGMYRPGASNKAGRFREGYGLHNDAMQQDDYDDWQREALALTFGAVSRAVFYNHRPRVEHGRLRVPLSFDYGDVPLRQIIIWDRGTGIDVNLRAFCTRQEWVMLFAHDDFRLVDHSASGRGDVWRLGMEHERLEHPAPFPVSLPQTAIETSGAASVLDPFMGSGATGVAAVRTGASFVGIELEPRWFDLSCRRIEEAYKQPRLFSEPEPKPVQTDIFAANDERKEVAA